MDKSQMFREKDRIQYLFKFQEFKMNFILIQVAKIDKSKTKIFVIKTLNELNELPLILTGVFSLFSKSILYFMNISIISTIKRKKN